MIPLSPAVTHVAALRHRLAELQGRIGELLDRIEASPRTADGTGVVMDAAMVALFAELARAAHEADEVSASVRALIAQDDASHCRRRVRLARSVHAPRHRH